jgi:2-methylcitrate dehydratase PrpD
MTTPTSTAQQRSPEFQLAEFITHLSLANVPAASQRIVRLMAMAVIGTGFAGANEDGVAALRELLLESGGSGQATTMVFGDKLPAHAAAQFNGTLCRALDYCDAMAPGPHFGAALFPAALAAAELAQSCSGAEFLTALVAGAEVGARFNLSEAQYNGFDPTGIAVVFASTACAARILKLNTEQTLNALALAFNRCGGSFQSHVDGSLGVRIVQGWVAETGVRCAQLAKRGVTGPQNFLAGHYGYAHLYGKGTLDPATVVKGLGSTWRLHNVVFKKYPSCGVTQGLTELALRLVKEASFSAEEVEAIEVRLPPYAHRLVGHPFQVGANPRVDAQFSAAYCVANAFTRKSSKLAHFAPAQVMDAAVHSLIARISVVADPAMDSRGHTAVDLNLRLRNGQTYHRELDIAPGFPGADLNDEQHLARFHDCLAYAPYPPSQEQVRNLLDILSNLGKLADARVLLRTVVAATTPLPTG